MKAVIFDCFGVIYPDTLSIVSRHFIKEANQKSEVNTLRQRNDSGLLSRDDFWDKAAEIFGITRHELELELNKVRTADWELLDYIKKLKSSYKTAMLSNVGRGFLERIFDQEHPQSDYFDEVVASGEIGVGKPDPRAYQIVCERLGVEPQAAVFIDDNPGHCEGAERVGLSTIVYQDFEQMKSELEEILQSTNR